MCRRGISSAPRWPTGPPRRRPLRPTGGGTPAPTATRRRRGRARASRRRSPRRRLTRPRRRRRRRRRPATTRTRRRTLRPRSSTTTLGWPRTPTTSRACVRDRGREVLLQVHPFLTIHCLVSRFLTNRAAVHLEMGDAAECIKDCDEAVTRARELRADYKLVAKARAPSPLFGGFDWAGSRIEGGSRYILPHRFVQHFL